MVCVYPFFSLYEICLINFVFFLLKILQGVPEEVPHLMLGKSAQFVCVSVCRKGSVCVRLCVRVCRKGSVCVRVCVSVCRKRSVCMCVCMCVRMSVCIYVCIRF